MFIVRLLLLVLLALYGWSMGQTPPSGLNVFGKLVAFSFFLTVPALYLLPTYEAWTRKHPSVVSIAVVNVFLGWSLIGWVVAYAWALNRQPAAAKHAAGVSAEQPPAVQQARHASTGKKTCPYCAEEIMEAAIKCKHCGSDLLAPVAGR